MSIDGRLADGDVDDDDDDDDDGGVGEHEEEEKEVAPEPVSMGEDPWGAKSREEEWRGEHQGLLLFTPPPQLKPP